MCAAMQYCDVITNPIWRMATISKIAESPYLSEKSFDFDEIWYTVGVAPKFKSGSRYPDHAPFRGNLSFIG